MPKLRVLSGNEVLKIFLSLGFEKVVQKGSLVKLARILHDGTKQTSTIPNQNEFDKGTIKAIYR